MGTELQIRPLRKSVIREDYFRLVGQDFKAAVVLNQLMYWTKRTYDFDKFILEEQERNPECNIQPRQGWIIKKSQDLIDETMLGITVPTMRKVLQFLCEKGWIIEALVDGTAWNKTMKYRVNLITVKESLEKLGYPLSDVVITTVDRKERVVNAEVPTVDPEANEHLIAQFSKNPTSDDDSSNLRNLNSYKDREIINKNYNINYSPHHVHEEHISNTSSSSVAPTEKNERQKIANAMLEIFSETILQGQKLKIYPEREEKLLAVMNVQLSGKLENWRVVCNNIRSSKFLMGEVKDRNFKANLNWVLENHHVTRILEKDYGVGDRVVVEQKPLQSHTEALKLVSSLNEPEVMKKLMAWFIDTQGVATYESWFKQATLAVFNGSKCVIQVTSPFVMDFINKHFASAMRNYLGRQYKQDISLEIETTSPIQNQEVV